MDERDEVRRLDGCRGEVGLDRSTAPGRQADSFGEDPPVDLGDEPVPLGPREEHARENDLAVASDHPKEELFAPLFVGERHDRLGVQNEAILVEGITDAPDPAERGELSLEGGLLLLLLGDVAEDHDHALVGGAVPESGCGVGDRQHGAVSADEGVIGDPNSAPRGRDLQDGALGGGRLRAVASLGVHGRVHRPAKQLVLRPTQRLRCGWIGERDESLAIEHVHALGHVSHEDPVELLSLLAVGDLEHDVPDADDLLLDLHRVVAGQPVPEAPRVVRARHADLHAADGLSIEGAAIGILELRPDLGHHLLRGTADHLVGRHPADPGQGLVDADHAQVPIDELEAHRSGRLDALQQRGGLERLLLRAAQRELQLLPVVDVGGRPDPRSIPPSACRTGRARNACQRNSPSKRRIR